MDETEAEGYALFYDTLCEFKAKHPNYFFNEIARLPYERRMDLLEEYKTAILAMNGCSKKAVGFYAKTFENALRAVPPAVYKAFIWHLLRK